MNAKKMNAIFKAAKDLSENELTFVMLELSSFQNDKRIAKYGKITAYPQGFGSNQGFGSKEYDERVECSNAVDNAA